MNCQKCGSEIPNNKEICLKCGYKIEKKLTNNYEKYYKNNWKHKLKNIIQLTKDDIKVSKQYKKRLSKKKIIIISSSVVTILLLIMGLTFLVPCIKFQYAMSLFTSKHYQNAITVFSQIQNYPNSRRMIEECKYQQGQQAFQNGNHSEESITLIENDLKNAISIFSKLGNYKDSIKLLKQAKYDYAKQEISDKNYISAISILSDLGNYQDSKSFLTDATYQLAVQDYKTGDFNTAEDLFQKIESYQDSSKQLSNAKLMQNYQGTWQDTYKTTQLIFLKWQVTIIYNPNTSNNKSYTFNCILDNNSLKEEGSNNNYVIDSNSDLNMNNNGLITQYKKLSDTTNLKLDPQIGMTSQQVLDSSWGKPSHINKTTTANIVHEQWCYSNNKYIYFDNGIVTAIQD